MNFETSITPAMNFLNLPVVGAVPPVEIFTLYLPLAGMAFGLIVVVIAMWSKAQDNRLKHETIRAALEKGQPIPAGLGETNDLDSSTGTAFSSPEERRWARKQRTLVDLRVGLICLGVAGGLFFLAPVIAPLMAFTGLAFIISWLVGRRAERDFDNRN